MFQSPTPTAPIVTSRRSTRATRTDTSYAIQSTYKKRKKTKSTITNASASDVAQTLKRKNFNSGPARKFAKVLRPPAANVGFKTLKWVPVEELTFEEKLAWDEEQNQPKGKVLTEKVPGEKGGDEKKDSEGKEQIGEQKVGNAENEKTESASATNNSSDNNNTSKGDGSTESVSSITTSATTSASATTTTDDSKVTEK